MTSPVQRDFFVDELYGITIFVATTKWAATDHGT